MGAIRTGIWNHFRASDVAPLYVDLSGTRLYYSEAPEQVTSPYCVFHIFDEIYDFTFDLDFENVLIQFSYYAATADICDDGVTDVKAMFDYAALTIAGYTCLRLERETVFTPSKIQPDDIWESTVRYTLLIQKN